jgi:methionyl-tRNA formyltransferase
LIPQLQDDAQACYAGKLTKQEALIDWYKDAELLHREVRAFNPWPVSYTTLNGTLVKIWSVRHSIDSVECEPGKVLSHDRQGIRVCCGAGTLEIKELQFAGKNRAMAAQLLNSRNLTNEFFGG